MKSLKQLAYTVSMMVGLVGIVYAEEAPKAAEPVHVTLVSINAGAFGGDVKIAPSDFPNGVYVRVKEMFGERPFSASRFANKLRAQGFKVVDKVEDADIMMTIRSGTINFKDIDEQTDSMSAGKTDAIVGVVGSAIVTGGLSLLVSDYSFLNSNKPVYSDMTVRFESAKQAIDQVSGMNGTIKTDASNSKATRVTFEIMSDEWLKFHVKQSKDASGQPQAESPASVATK